MTSYRIDYKQLGNELYWQVLAEPNFKTENHSQTANYETEFYTVD